MISDLVQLYNCTTIDGGAVIKFDAGYLAPGVATIQVMGSLTCNTKPYYPAILTTWDDTSVGQGYSGYPPQAYFGMPPFLDLKLATSNRLSNLRFNYADVAVTTPTDSRMLDVWDCQFVACNSAIDCEVGGSGACISLHNVLFSAPGVGFAVVSSGNNIEIDGEQVTADVLKFSDALTPPSKPSKIALNNSIIKGALGDTLNSSLLSSAIDPSVAFEVAVAGGYYLPTNSPHHQSGLAPISASLLTELRNKTTYAPISIPAWTIVAGDMTFSPQILRDASGPLDKGYHYDVLDYTVSEIGSSGNITVLPGTVIGYRTDVGAYDFTISAIGFDLWGDSRFVSHGTPEKPNIFVDVQLVQEQFELPVMSGIIPDLYLGADGPSQSPPSLDFRFSTFYAANFVSWLGRPPDHLWSGEDTLIYTGDPQDPYGFVSWASAFDLNLRDCQLNGGLIQFGPPVFMACYQGTSTVSWTNNSFENVSIDLSAAGPYYDDPCQNVDFSFRACNNLFKGGLWFHLRPMQSQSTGANWSFTNNVFDHVPIMQDVTDDHSAHPFDYDYNAYSPPTDAELSMAWQLWDIPATGQLQIPAAGTQDGVHDITLNSALPYQKGPFGDFYLPNNTALYGAGSDTPANLGLYNYTTRLDQTKEGKEVSGHESNIGVHYVATSGQYSTLSLDSDNDGIPDYLENWHGDGDMGPTRVHMSDETDWSNPMTDGAVADASNAVYLDFDLSEDGVVGRIKGALGALPFDTTNPLKLTQVITGEEPDTNTFRVPILYNVLTNIGMINLLIDGYSATFLDVEPNADGSTLMKWITTYDSPGLHRLQAELTLNGMQRSGGAPDPTVLTALGPWNYFNSQNLLQFSPFYDEFDDEQGALLHASLPSFGCSADYSIELTTTNGQHITTKSGHVEPGVGSIDETWYPLTDDDDNIITDDTINVMYDVTLTDPATATTLHRKHGLSMYWNKMRLVQGNFTIAYAWDNASQAQNSLKTCIQFAAVDSLIKPTWAGGENDNPYGSTFNDFTYWGNLYGTPLSAGYIDTWTRKTALTNDLAQPETKNFYFYGHGSFNDIGNAFTVNGG